MSCQACEEAQAGTTSAYFRWGRANIELKGCAEHLREVIEALREWQRVDQIVKRSLGEDRPIELPAKARKVLEAPTETVSAVLAYRLRAGGGIVDWATHEREGRSYLTLRGEQGLETTIEVAALCP